MSRIFYFRLMDNTIAKIYSLFLEYGRVFTDSRMSENGGLYFALKGERFDGNSYAISSVGNGAHYAIVDQEEIALKSDKLILVPNVLEALQKLANHHRRQFNIPILAITGTNGKTTTKELITSVLRQKFNVLSTEGNLNNHIGVPLTLLQINSEHDIAVIEMGANHVGEIEFLCNIAEPDYGIITNVGKAHLEGFGSFEGVKKAKGELYRFIANYGKAIFINADNSHLLEMSAGNNLKFTYGVNNDTAELKGSLAGNNIYITAKVLFPKGWLYFKTKLTGAYNLENILAAARIGTHLNIDPLQIQQGIESYVPENNRSQVSQKGGATFIVDCYNANPTSMQASIDNFAGIMQSNKVYVLGDMLEMGDDSEKEHQQIVDKLLQMKADNVFLIGTCFKETEDNKAFRKFNTIDEFIENVEPVFWTGKFVLLKGSRGIRLEKVLETL